MSKFYSVGAKCVFRNASGYRIDLKNVYQVAGLSIHKSLTQIHRCLSSAVYLHDRANHLQKSTDVTIYIPDKLGETHRYFSTTAFVCKKTKDNNASLKKTVPDTEKELAENQPKTAEKGKSPVQDPRIALSTVSKDLSKPLTKVPDIPQKYEKVDEKSEDKGSTKTEKFIHIDKKPPPQCPQEPLQPPPPPPPLPPQPASRAETDKAVIKQNAVGDIVVKTEVQKDKVTKVTIEKSKPPEENKEETPEVKVKKRLLIDFSASYTERNFITPMRAMTEYLLKQSDLESLPKVLRRSPYESAPPMTVYYRKDVEGKAIAIWGSREALEKELLRREIDRRRYEQDVFTVKRRLRIYRREMTHKRAIEGEGLGLKTRSGRVVLTAIAINGCNFVFKLCAWLYTGSHSMFSESIHSLADTVNQLILAYGIHKSVQMADTNHPYGYTNMRYVSSLISGVGIFCVGSGLSIYHGITGIIDPVPLNDFFWAYFVLGGAVVSEGATLLVALSAIRKGAKEADMTLSEYVLRGSDPSVNVVLLEDTAAVGGVLLAGGCMAAAQYAGSALPDAVGSLLVGSLLGGVASFIILTNVGALVGRSIRQEQLDEINNVLERDFMIRAIHDVKGIDMGSNLIRYKAEVDFDGRALTRSYLEKHDLNALLQDMKKIDTIDDVESFMLRHGENIVDMLGGEIDRIELKLRKKFPQIRHCDLEIL